MGHLLTNSDYFLKFWATLQKSGDTVGQVWQARRPLGLRCLRRRQPAVFILIPHTPHHAGSLSLCVCVVHRIGAVIWGSGGVKPVMVGGRGRDCFRKLSVSQDDSNMEHRSISLSLSIQRIQQECFRWKYKHIFRFNSSSPLIGFPLHQRTERRTNAFCNFDKYILQFGQMHLTIWTNTFYKFDKYNLQFGQIPPQEWKYKHIFNSSSDLLFSSSENREFFCWHRKCICTENQILETHFVIQTNKNKCLDILGFPGKHFGAKQG